MGGEVVSVYNFELFKADGTLRVFVRIQNDWRH